MTHKDNILTREGMLKILDLHKVFNSTPYQGAFSDLCLRYAMAILQVSMNIPQLMIFLYAPEYPSEISRLPQIADVADEKDR